MRLKQSSDTPQVSPHSQPLRHLQYERPLPPTLGARLTLLIEKADFGPLKLPRSPHFLDFLSSLIAPYSGFVLPERQ